MHLQTLSVLQQYNSNLEAFTQGALILILAVAIILANAVIIASIVNFRGPSEVINHYLLSLAFADLLCGLIIVPLSVYPAITGTWLYPDPVCSIVGYLEVTLWSITVYTFMWISVDRYLAVRKPLRYETVQTKTRCQCWMAFTWISSAMLCCPPFLSGSTTFDEDAYICKLNWSNISAYSITLAILVLGPSVISIVHNFGYIFIMMRRIRSGAPIHDKEYATALAENLANPSHLMSFALVFSFIVSWTPFISVRSYEVLFNTTVHFPLLNFALVWFGIMNSFWKFLILTSMSPQFRLALRVFCLTICCKTKGRLQAELIGMDPDD